MNGEARQIPCPSHDDDDGHSAINRTMTRACVSPGKPMSDICKLSGFDNFNSTICDAAIFENCPIADGMIQIVRSSISRLDATADEMIGGFASACLTVYWLVMARISFILDSVG